MSLIVDALKRLEGKGKRPKVHPAFLKGTDKTRGNRRYLFLIFSTVFALSALGAYFVSQVFADRMLRSEVKLEEPPKHQEEIQKVQTVSPSGSTGVEGMPREVPREKETPPKPVKVESKSTGAENTLQEVPKEKEPPPKPVVKAKKARKVQTASLSRDTGSEKMLRELPRDKDLSPPLPNLLYLADKAFSEGKLTESMGYYEEAFERSKDPKVAKNLLVVYLKLGLQEKARSLISQVKEEEIPYTYLVELVRSGAQEMAVKEGESLKDLDTSGKVLFALGYAYEALGDYERALENYREAYRKNPKDPYIAVNYARLLEATGNLREAYRIYMSLNSPGLDPRIKLLVEERVGYLRGLGF